MYLGKVLPVMTAEVDALFFGVIIVLILSLCPEASPGVRTNGIGVRRAGERLGR